MKKEKIDTYSEESIMNTLHLLDEVPDRDNTAAKQTRMAYINQINQVADTHPGWIGQIAAYVTGLTGNRKRKASMSFITILLAVLLFLGAGGGTAYAAQTAMPDEMLYPVKLFTEDVLVEVTNAPESRVNLLQYYANRRIEEITQEILDGDVPDEAIQARLEEQLRLMVAAIDQTSGQDQNRLREQARNTLIQQDQIMTILQQYSGEGQKEALDATQNQVRNQLQNLGAGIPDPQLMRERIQNQQETQMEMTPQSNRYGQPSDVPQPGQAGTPEPKDQPQGNSPQGFQYGLTITPTGTVTNNYQYQYYYGISTGPMQNQFGQPSGNGTQDAGQD